MESRTQKINRSMIIGWTSIIAVLLIPYSIVLLRDEMTLQHYLLFMVTALIPAIFCAYLYKKKPDRKDLCWYIMAGYLCMYTYVMMTGSTSMVFCYVLPMITMMILYHKPKLILYSGIACFVINIMSIAFQIAHGVITVENFRDAEIQIISLIFCFVGAFLSTRLYEGITEQNKSYVGILDEKNKQIQRIILQTIATIANTIDAKDEYTRGHSRRVAEYATAIARELDLPDGDVKTIHSVALLHDIGKIGVPDFVLNKPGRLTDEEYQMMKQHTVIGGEILKDIRMISWMDVGARYHHERYDGTGYPEGLAKDEIPFIARIIAVADAYDAMTSNRVYRKRLNDDSVLKELRDGRGKQFDPIVCDTMVKLLEEHRLQDISPDIVDDGETEDAAEILRRAIEGQDERMRISVFMDELTETYKRGYGEKLIREMLEQTTGCLMLFDVDRFYRINASAGYIQGDMFLQSVAECIRQMAEGLVVCRYGDDEFLVFAERLKFEKDVVQRVGNFMTQIQRKNEEWNTPERLSVSVGIVFCDEHKTMFSEAVRKADQALLYAKQQGGGSYHIHREAEKTEERNLSTKDLEELLVLLRNKENYQGAFRLSYPEFGRIYEFVDKVARRNGQRVQLMMFTIASGGNQRFSEDERDYVMTVLENAIVKSVRGVDVTTKYSSTQRLVLLMNLDAQNVHIVTERITKEFYKNCDIRGVRLYYDAADLDMDGKAAEIEAQNRSKSE